MRERAVKVRSDIKREHIGTRLRMRSVRATIPRDVNPSSVNFPVEGMAERASEERESARSYTS